LWPRRSVRLSTSVTSRAPGQVLHFRRFARVAGTRAYTARRRYSGPRWAGYGVSRPAVSLRLDGSPRRSRRRKWPS